jgi:hypothetical protein
MPSALDPATLAWLVTTTGALATGSVAATGTAAGGGIGALMIPAVIICFGGTTSDDVDDVDGNDGRLPAIADKVDDVTNRLNTDA